MNYLWLTIIAGIAAAPSKACDNGFTITKPEDLNEVQACRTINGHVTINPTTTFDINLDANSISGGLTIRGDYVEKVQLKNLNLLTGILSIENTKSLKQLNINSLQTHTGNFHIINAPALHEVKANKLSFINGDLKIYGVKSLRKIPFINLAAINLGLYLENIQGIPLISFPGLREIKKQLSIINSDATTVRFINLNTICDNFNVNSLSQLNKIDLRSLKAYQLKININSNSVTDIQLGKIVAGPGSSIVIKDNKDELSKHRGEIKYNCEKYMSWTNEVLAEPANEEEKQEPNSDNSSENTSNSDNSSGNANNSISDNTNNQNNNSEEETNNQINNHSTSFAVTLQPWEQSLIVLMITFFATLY